MLFKFFSRKIIYSVIGCVFSVSVLAGCFSPWSGDDATIIISLGGASDNRTAVFENPPQASNLTYKVILTNGPSIMEPVIVPPGKNEIKISVAPGRWDITIAAYLEDEKKLYAKGIRKGVDIKAGQNSVSINMEYIYYADVDIIIDKEVKIILTNPDNLNTDDIKISENGGITGFTAAVKIQGVIPQEINCNWHIWGSPIPIYENKSSIIINAKDYNSGKYQLMVVVLINDNPYSDEIYFTVVGD